MRKGRYTPFRMNASTQLESETKSNFSAWQDSALLKEELVLLFDNELNAVLGEVRLHYDIKTGLTYEKE